MDDKLGIKFIFITIVIIGFAGLLIDASIGIGTNFYIVFTIASATGFIIYAIRDAQGLYDLEEEGQDDDENCNEE